MSIRNRSSSPKETLTERIFRKVAGRKMTPAERLCFRLKSEEKQIRKKKIAK